MSGLLGRADRRWIEDELLPTLGIESLDVEERPDYHRPYPDIWCRPATSTITVTSTWAALPYHERRKRILHEMLHIKGMEHNARSRKLGYYSRPERDTFTKNLYRRLFK